MVSWCQATTTAAATTGVCPSTTATATATTGAAATKAVNPCSSKQPIQCAALDLMQRSGCTIGDSLYKPRFFASWLQWNKEPGANSYPFLLCGANSAMLYSKAQKMMNFSESTDQALNRQCVLLRKISYSLQHVHILCFQKLCHSMLLSPQYIVNYCCLPSNLCYTFAEHCHWEPVCPQKCPHDC